MNHQILSLFNKHTLSVPNWHIHQYKAYIVMATTDLHVQRNASSGFQMDFTFVKWVVPAG